MIAYIGLGSNLKDPQRQLVTAMDHIQQLPDTMLTARSSIYQSAPQGVTDQPHFYNQVIAVETTLSPHALLQALMDIEAQMGRVREKRWGPRVIDCDLLLVDDFIIETDALILPHPRMTERAFVLLPLAEIAPHCVLPSGQLISAFCEAVADQEIKKYESLS